MRFYCLPFLFLVFLSTGSLHAVEFKKEYHETFAVKNGMALKLYSGDGDVTIKAWDKDEVKVDIVYHADHGGGREDDRAFEVEFDLSNRALHIVSQERTGSRFGISSRRIYRYTYDIMAPDYLILDIQGDDGNTYVSGWRSNVECDMDDGELQLTDIVCEELYVRMADGDATIENVEAEVAIWADDGDVDLIKITSNDGRIELKDGSCQLLDCAGNFKVRLDDGDIKMTGMQTDKLDIRGNDGRIELELVKSEKPDILLQTDDGPIRVNLHKDISVEMSIETDDGDFSVNLPNENKAKEGRNWYQGVLNEGTGELTIRTNDGSVRVREL